jgi:hypothetical protein
LVVLIWVPLEWFVDLFGVHAFLKLDRLAFCKGLKTVSLNLGEMNKEVFFVFRLNEAMTLTFVKPILLFLLP